MKRIISVLQHHNKNKLSLLTYCCAYKIGNLKISRDKVYKYFMTSNIFHERIVEPNFKIIKRLYIWTSLMKKCVYLQNNSDLSLEVGSISFTFQSFNFSLITHMIFLI